VTTLEQIEISDFEYSNYIVVVVKLVYINS